MTFNANTFSGAITKALVLQSGTSSIYANTIESSLAAGAGTANIGIDVVGGNHTLGDETQTFNTIDGYAIGINVNNAATASGSYNKFLNNTKDVTTDKAGSFIEIFKSWFGHAGGPTDDTDQGSGGTVEGNVEYSPFITTADMNKTKLDGVIVIQDNTDTAIGYATTLAEAMTNIAALETAYQDDDTKPQPVKALLKRNFTHTREADIDFSVDGITYECTAGQTITDTNGTVVLSASNATITGCTIDDDLEITGDNNTISNNTLKATVTIAGNNASISGNTFTMTGADTAITSPGTNNAFTGLEIINNTFSGDGSYIGIDLKDDFGNPAANPAETDTQAITCLLYTSPSPRDQRGSRMPSSA